MNLTKERTTYDTVLFDLDGTLLNTLDDLADSVNFALRESGYPQRAIDEVRRFIGNGVAALMKRAVPEGTDQAKIDETLECFRAHYSENMRNKTKPYDGIIPLLYALQARGIKTAVISNKYHTAVQNLCDEVFPHLIDAAFGESETLRPKPAPDIVNAAMSALRAKKETTLYVGDSDTDGETACSAGLFFVGVTWGYRDKDVLEAAGAGAIIDEPMELIDLL